MKTDATQDRTNNRLHQHYTAYLVGDGATKEFFLAHNILTLSTLMVTVGGVRQRVSDRGVAHDYSVRGLTPGYSGDQNAIKFAVAPINDADIVVDIVAT